MVPNLSTRGADVVGDLVLLGDVGGERQRLGGGRQVLDRGLEIGFPAVDRDDAGAALGEQLHGGGADDAGRAGDDGDPAVEPNSIGHCWCFLWLAPVVPDFHGFRAGAARSRS